MGRGGNLLYDNDNQKTRLPESLTVPEYLQKLSFKDVIVQIAATTVNLSPQLTYQLLDLIYCQKLLPLNVFKLHLEHYMAGNNLNNEINIVFRFLHNNAFRHANFNLVYQDFVNDMFIKRRNFLTTEDDNGWELLDDHLSDLLKLIPASSRELLRKKTFVLISQQFLAAKIPASQGYMAKMQAFRFSGLVETLYQASKKQTSKQDITAALQRSPADDNCLQEIEFIGYLQER